MPKIQDCYVVFCEEIPIGYAYQNQTQVSQVHGQSIQEKQELVTQLDYFQQLLNGSMVDYFLNGKK